MTDDIQRYEFLGRELQDYLVSLSSSTETIKAVDLGENINPNPNLPSE